MWCTYHTLESWLQTSSGVSAKQNKPWCFQAELDFSQQFQVLLISRHEWKSITFPQQAVLKSLSNLDDASDSRGLMNQVVAPLPDHNQITLKSGSPSAICIRGGEEEVEQCGTHWYELIQTSLIRTLKMHKNMAGSTKMDKWNPSYLKVKWRCVSALSRTSAVQQPNAPANKIISGVIELCSCSADGTCQNVLTHMADEDNDEWDQDV